MRRVCAGLIGIAVLAMAAGTAAQNRQPISVSLMECGEIHDAMAASAERRGSQTTDRIAAARRAAGRFRDAADAEARAEGQVDPAAALAAMRPDLTRKWTGRFADLTEFGDNMDWVKYCGALGKDRGVLPLPD